MEQEQRDMETLLSTFAESTGDQQDQSFSQDDNVVPKKKRWSGENVSHRRFKQFDFNKNNFIIDILSF